MKLPHFFLASIPENFDDLFFAKAVYLICGNSFANFHEFRAMPISQFLQLLSVHNSVMAAHNAKVGNSDK